MRSSSESTTVHFSSEIDVFLELCCIFDDSADVGNLISGSSDFSKTSLNIWKFTVHILLKTGLENTLAQLCVIYFVEDLQILIFRNEQ